MIINRKEQTTAIDRIDSNWWNKEAFLGRRDLFYMEGRAEQKEKVTFVRHDFWVPKLDALAAGFTSTFSAWSYRRAFGYVSK